MSWFILRTSTTTTSATTAATTSPSIQNTSSPKRNENLSFGVDRLLGKSSVEKSKSLNDKIIIQYISVSQPFGLQVPVEGNFMSLCPGKPRITHIFSQICKCPKFRKKCICSVMKFSFGSKSKEAYSPSKCLIN